MPNEIILIAAVTVDGFIARHKKEKIQWSQDLFLFKEQTMGHPIIMGSNTHETLAMELEGRDMIVVHRDDDPKTCLLYTSPSPRDLSTSRMPSSA